MGEERVGRWNQHEVGYDPASVEAREADEFWICSCGLCRRSVSTMFDHCKSKGHGAKYVDREGNVIMFMEHSG